MRSIVIFMASICLFISGCADIQKLSSQVTQAKGANNSDKERDSSTQTLPKVISLPNSFPKDAIDIYDVFVSPQDYIGEAMPGLLKDKYYSDKRVCVFWKARGIGCNDKFAQQEFEENLNKKISGIKKTNNKNLPSYLYAQTNFVTGQDSYDFDKKKLFFAPSRETQRGIQIDGLGIGSRVAPGGIIHCYRTPIFDRDSIIFKSNERVGYLIATIDTSIATRGSGIPRVIGHIDMSESDAKQIVGGKKRVNLPGFVLYKVTKGISGFASSSCTIGDGVGFSIVPVKYVLGDVLGKSIEVSNFVGQSL